MKIMFQSSSLIVSVQLCCDHLL